MKFYDCESAPSPRRVRIFLAEKGIEIPSVQIDLASGEQLEPEFLKLNPDATVPVLQLDSGTCLTQVNAICLFLEEHFKDSPRLLGQTAEQRALIWSSSLGIEQQLLMGIAESFRNHTKGMRNRALPGPLSLEQIPALVPRGRKRVQYYMGVLDERLQSADFVAGDDYSMADITAQVAVDFAAWIKLPISTEHDALRDWHKRVSARPSAVA